MPATVANFFSKLMFHIFRNEIWTITTNSLAKSTPEALSWDSELIWDRLPKRIVLSFASNGAT